MQRKLHPLPMTGCCCYDQLINPLNAPLTVTCGTKQVQTSLESTTIDPSGRTILSVHLMLASEQQIRPNLTLEKLKLELASNPAVKKISLPLPKEW